MPGKMAISSAEISPIPWDSISAEMYSWTSVQLFFISWMTSTSRTSRFSLTVITSLPISMSRESPTECAESVLIRMVRYPSSDSLYAVAADVDVFPTPPLPV